MRNVMLNTTVNKQRKEGDVLINNALNTFYLWLYGRKEGNVLFNNASKTFYLWLYGRKEGIFFLYNNALKHFIYGYME